MVSIPFKRESGLQGGDDPQRQRPSRVSIPFKRERVWQVVAILRIWRGRCLVSIPFKRERVWQGDPSEIERGNRNRTPCFNSLQTGKGMASV